jgi:DNA-binding transcriptional LysR family regulator
VPRKVFRILADTVSGSHITTLPSTTLRVYGGRFALKALPVAFPGRPWPAVIVTLKNRTLSPVVERFIQHIRDFTQPMRAEGSARRR